MATHGAIDVRGYMPAERDKNMTLLREAQEDVRRLRRLTDLQALDESQIRSDERDNAISWYATADSASPDPLKRVFLFAYEDSKIVFIRGLPADVTFAREVKLRDARTAAAASLG